MKFQPKKDLLYGVILIPIGVFCITFGVLFPFTFDADIVSIIVITVLFLPLGVYSLWCWFGTSYLIYDDTFIIKQGPFRRTISIDTIEKIERNTNPLVASTALSLESYILQYKPYKHCIISPENIDIFVVELQRKRERTPINFIRD
ncbi:PH domain-containing protein [Alkalicoccobacillus porphyridii]|uniref:Uncharacterized protein YyaB-like PH domain-containing protein n=1 Tax=Alkalicoccobacillus porphyridii TaxID=2597270 RepID=A0A553ZVQ7_9BACI|nr:PH domain-containing protein [Alkalicoccobacillus porphyridii]TSB45561.1 hypothetical protein FN960_15440 [Alkalicoccobacillus porphyridii]